MKRLLMVLGLCGGLLGVSSLLYAADAEPGRTQVQEEKHLVLLGCDDLRQTEPGIYYYLLSVAEQAEARRKQGQSSVLDEDGPLSLSVDLTGDCLVCVLTDRSAGSTDDESQAVTVALAERNESGQYITGPTLTFTPLTEAQVAEEQKEAAWDAWQTDFKARLAADEKYLAAEKALSGWAGDDDEEYAIFEDARARRYREVALMVYQEHFGEWTGTVDEFDKLMADISIIANIESCGAAAVLGCGKGKVCWVRSSGEGCCTFACYDGKGECPDYPAPSVSTE